MKRIRIFKNDGGWMKELECEPEIKSLFGMMVSETFTASAAVVWTLEEIIRRKA